MGELKVGDIVARKSYGCDVFFKVVDIRNEGTENIVTLKGISYRIEADAPETDLIVQTPQVVEEYNRKVYRSVEKKEKDLSAASLYASKQATRYRGYPKKTFYRDTASDDFRKFSMPGKILHLDGDESYLSTCIDEYKKLGLDAVGRYVPEKEQPAAVIGILEQYRPDILVLTGHDGLIKGEGNFLNLSNYRNSRYFVEAVKAARKYCADLDGLVIFAGACQSMYNEIIKAGANFASAPYRVLIHALDPVFICQKIAFTSADRFVSPQEVVKSTITGVKGIGGLQTRGKYRDGYPLEPYNN